MFLGRIKAVVCGLGMRERNLRLGLHVSISGSIVLAVERALDRGCNTFQMFTRNPRGWFYRELRSEEVSEFRRRVGSEGLDPVFVHMPYLPNLASPKEVVYRKSVDSLKVELERCVQLGVPYLVTHLGSHLGRGIEYGFERIVEAIDWAFSKVEGDVTLLLENTAGGRNTVGSRLEEIAEIMDRVGDDRCLGVCYDTCHGFASGYDMRTPEAVTNLIEVFDSLIGLERLKVVHLNDSRGDLGSRLDRHEHIGLGKIGESGFMSILQSPLGEKPLILETPIDSRRSDCENLAKVRELAKRVFSNLEDDYHVEAHGFSLDAKSE